jgi:hypothetical protein
MRWGAPVQNKERRWRRAKRLSSVVSRGSWHVCSELGLLIEWREVAVNRDGVGLRFLGLRLGSGDGERAASMTYDSTVAIRAVASIRFVRHRSVAWLSLDQEFE